MPVFLLSPHIRKNKKLMCSSTTQASTSVPTPRQEGFEMQLGFNHLDHFLLNHLAPDFLLK
jgi:hypothetical protein